MTMKPLCSILVATSFGIVSAVEPVTTETTSMLRGNKVTRRRTVYPLSHQIEDDHDSLVDAPEHHHSYVKLRGRSNDGKESGISISMDLDKLENYYKEHIQYHDHIRRGQGLSSSSEEYLSGMADEDGFANPSESPNRNGGHLRSHEMNDAATEEDYEKNLQEDYRNGGYLRSHDFEDNDVSEDDDEYYFQEDYGYEGEGDEEQKSSGIWSSALVQEQAFEAQFLLRKSAIQEPDEEESTSNIWSSAIVQKQVFEAQFHLGATQETDAEEQEVLYSQHAALQEFEAQFHLGRSGTGEKDIGLLGARVEENFNEEDAYGFQGNFEQQLNQTVSEIAREDMPLEHHLPDRNDVHFGSHTPLDIHFAKHDDVEEDHHHHHHHYHHHHDDARFEKNDPENMEETDEHFNETRFHDLFDAPFYIYEQALGHDVIVGEPFPIFSMPVWEAVPGKIFSGFNKIGEALYFENDNFLLDWEGMKSPSTSSGNDLQDFIANSNFESHLVVGKAIRHDSEKVPFLGLVVSYYQKGSKEYNLVPLAHLEDFFNEPSGESRVLRHLLEQKRPSNDTSNFYYPDLVWSDYMGTQEIKEKLEDLESIHFQKLYQLLIRRSFLFSYGYADCLRRDPNSKELRVCLDHTFYEIVKIETEVRGALEDRLLDELSELDKSFRSNVKEACLSFEGGMIGTDSCTHIPTNHLATFFASSFQSF